MLRICAQVFGGNLHRHAIQRAAYHITASQPIPAFTEVKELDGVREITLNDAKTRNSLSMEMMTSLDNDLCKDLDDVGLRCIVLTANGPIWSAGHNLKELSSVGGSVGQKEIFDKLTEIILNIRAAPVPVIAKVNGLAAAAGCQLVASCDIVVCSENSSFSTPGANFGIFCSTPGIAIGRVMPRLKSSYMLMTGLPISAKEASDAGLVTKVVPECKLDKEVEKITAAIRSKSRRVIALGKEFFYTQLEMGLEKAYEAGSQTMVNNLHLPDGQEGLNSFKEKRKPNWSHN